MNVDQASKTQDGNISNVREDARSEGGMRDSGGKKSVDARTSGERAGHGGSRDVRRSGDGGERGGRSDYSPGRSSEKRRTGDERRKSNERRGSLAESGGRNATGRKLEGKDVSERKSSLRTPDRKLKKLDDSRESNQKSEKSPDGRPESKDTRRHGLKIVPALRRISLNYSDTDSESPHSSRENNSKRKKGNGNKKSVVEQRTSGQRKKEQGGESGKNNKQGDKRGSGKGGTEQIVQSGSGKGRMDQTVRKGVMELKSNGKDDLPKKTEVKKKEGETLEEMEKFLKQLKQTAKQKTGIK